MLQAIRDKNRRQRRIIRNDVAEGRAMRVPHEPKAPVALSSELRTV